MTNYQEKDLENFIEAYLLETHSYTQRKQEHYDKNLCLDTTLLENFLQSTQDTELFNLKKRIGEDYKDALLKRLIAQIKEKGILHILQQGIEIHGIKLKLAFLKPSNDSNPQSLENYAKNTLSVIRQLHYSTKNNNSLDMVIFLNGLPLITLELKNPFTRQNVFNAITQYKEDRDSRETLFSRCIVHFALDSDLVYMSTKLEGEKTSFLPFNRGLNNGSGEIGLQSGAGNPPSEGVKTAYLWERIFAKDILLSLIFDFAQCIKDDKNKAKIIFPRYHQFDVVGKLLADAKENGVGQRYLIQHSAGSGKSNSIAWLAHNLVSLHRVNQQGKIELVFDSVIVVTDRKILDSQIRENVKTFSHTKGLVEAITEGSKQLREALEEGKKIIITTIQKFPYILDDIKGLKAKHFAVIIDEAHSSQSGISAQKMGEAIRDKGESEKDEDTYKDSEDEILEIIKNKKLQPNASYFAFTATPKPKTLEMFGKPCKIEGIEKFTPFHLYSMKQAIEEGFILDVLRGYTTYKSYYKINSLLKDDDPRYDKKKANAKLKAYVEGDANAIAKKAEVMIEHFFTHSYKKIGGKAKAMVVTKSRKNAVKYYFAFQNYLKNHYPHFKALVAFSGEVSMGEQTYSESGLNGIAESRLKDEFKTKESYRFLIVAQKYQTGFDEPLLHTMYVDKKLSGVNAVQTLSRLNRVCKNKEDTCVLDFANTHEEIGEAFSTFYEQTFLGEPTDPNKIFDLKSNLSEYRIYTQEEVDSFTSMILKREKENVIHSKLDIMIKRYEQKSQEEKADFYAKSKTYLKDYSFLAQILPYEDIELEKTYILLKKLITKITPPKDEDLAKGILDNVDFDSYRIQLDRTENIMLEGNGELKPSQADGSSKIAETELDELSNIIKEFNERYGNTEWGEADKVARVLQNIKDDVKKDEDFINSFKYTDKQNLRIDFEKILEKKFQDFINDNFILFKRFNDDEKGFKKAITQIIFDMATAEMQQSLH